MVHSLILLACGETVDTVESLETKIRDELEPRRIEFVELLWTERRGGPRITLFVDNPDGAVDFDFLKTADGLATALLDEEIPGRYRLEVSSPGLDRPLRDDLDFRRNLGRRIAVRVEGGEHQGVLAEFDDEMVVLDQGRSEARSIERAAILKAVAVPDLAKPSAKRPH